YVTVPSSFASTTPSAKLIINPDPSSSSTTNPSTTKITISADIHRNLKNKNESSTTSTNTIIPFSLLYHIPIIIIHFNHYSNYFFHFTSRPFHPGQQVDLLDNFMEPQTIADLGDEEYARENENGAKTFQPESMEPQIITDLGKKRAGNQNWRQNPPGRVHGTSNHHGLGREIARETGMAPKLNEKARENGNGAKIQPPLSDCESDDIDLLKVMRKEKEEEEKMMEDDHVDDDDDDDDNDSALHDLPSVTDEDEEGEVDDDEFLVHFAHTGRKKTSEYYNYV
ncbi:hypothetical protein Pcinc_025178, partial [Petrolisthes cinctipes]